MVEVPNHNRLIEEALGHVPNELQQELRNWISRARKGEVSELDRDMLRIAEKGWRAFDEAVKEVEKILQQ